MRLRTLATTGLIVLALSSGCAGQTGTPAIDTGDKQSATQTPSGVPQMGNSQPATINNAAALKMALEAGGITDVHPVSGKVGAWAAITGFKRCPMYFEAVNGDAFRATHLRNADGQIVPVDMEGTTISPDATQILNWAAGNTLTAIACRGSQAPAENDWPTEAPK